MSGRCRMDLWASEVSPRTHPLQATPATCSRRWPKRFRPGHGCATHASSGQLMRTSADTGIRPPIALPGSTQHGAALAGFRGLFDALTDALPVSSRRRHLRRRLFMQIMPTLNAGVAPAVNTRTQHGRGAGHREKGPGKGTICLPTNRSSANLPPEISRPGTVPRLWPRRGRRRPRGVARPRTRGAVFVSRGIPATAPRARRSGRV